MAGWGWQVSGRLASQRPGANSEAEIRKGKFGRVNSEGKSRKGKFERENSEGEIRKGKFGRGSRGNNRRDKDSIEEDVCNDNHIPSET